MTNANAVHLLRHGETEWSRAHRHTGRTDVPLTAAGEAQARAAQEALAGHEFALTLVSPLQRARRTAELAGATGLRLCDDLMEVDYGAYEGLTTEQIRADVPGWTVWTHGCPGGETAADAGVRADRVLEQARAAAGDVLLVAHGHLLRILAARWLEQPASFGGRLRLDTATVSVLGYERETPVILRWNAR